jgi:hypothetical protein
MFLNNNNNKSIFCFKTELEQFHKIKKKRILIYYSSKNLQFLFFFASTAKKFNVFVCHVLFYFETRSKINLELNLVI